MRLILITWLSVTAPSDQQHHSDSHYVIYIINLCRLHVTVTLQAFVSVSVSSSHSYRSHRAGWRCSGWRSAVPDSPCSRSSSSFLPRRTSALPWCTDASWYWYAGGGEVRCCWRWRCFLVAAAGRLRPSTAAGAGWCVLQVLWEISELERERGSGEQHSSGFKGVYWWLANTFQMQYRPLLIWSVD